MHDSTQVNSACSGTSDWIKIVDFSRIDAGGEIDAGEVERLLPERRRVLRQRDRVQVYDAVESSRTRPAVRPNS